MGPSVHQWDQFIALGVGGHVQNPGALLHVDEGRCVQGVGVGPHNPFEIGIRKFAREVQLIFRAHRQGTVGPGQVHQHQGVAIQIGLRTQFNFVSL